MGIGSNNAGVGPSSGLELGSGRTGSPRLGIGPFSSSSRIRQQQGRLPPGKLFLPRTLQGQQPGSAGSGDGTSAGGSGGTGGGDDANGSDFPSAGGSHPSPIYSGGANPYHDDAVDWVVEGTGMRVAYDDFTTIGKDNILSDFL
jgi:hypothetical protein